MLKIKLSQVGKKHERSYRIVVAEARSKRDGKIVEKVGHYNPKAKNSQLTINKGRVNYWKEKGAQMTESVQKILKK
ncbi:MAG: 30S ribosomal protein S16 [Candidatus Shapirobacteria bacterium]|nr:30S ribosomal protein S16 [Candidatus Shapirobacteria bacterium]MDD5074015.1 30S ribosomal protein S16 [Candidatus Shapirobacteria bacterium]MDD5481541.1 30S ribosomal protein S16 [Candidatus Shapirobacteria bacterium]